ncbi:MAG: LCP family protein [Clostridia bacterium]
MEDRKNNQHENGMDDGSDQLMNDLFDAQQDDTIPPTVSANQTTEVQIPMEPPFEDELMESDFQQPAPHDAETRSELWQETAPTRREGGVEAFVPTEFYQRETPKKRRHRRRRRSRILWIALIALGIALLIAGGVFAYKIINHPSSFFGASSGKTPPPLDTIHEIDVAGTVTPEPLAATPTIDPYQQLYAQADLTMMKNIVNVLVIGVDYAEERETWNGKHDYHSDVMMILAINFDENRVDLISLPRDTYAKIPGVKGIYKLNASLNCGGGMEAPGGAGFLKSCEAASWMIGGIPVDYYFAVTMPAVKGLVDAVGGVDYELEMSYTMMGRKYKEGQQHMNGQAVLDYLRVRKNISSAGDWNRVNRQKKMMVALFQSMQKQNLILKIPDIVNSFEGQLFTNCSLGQTAALAAFAYNLSSENIGMYSMNGTMKNIFNWNFCITDQANRVKIVKTVFNVDVPEEKEYSMAYAVYRWADMRADLYLKSCEPLTDYVRSAIAADDLLPTAVPTLEPTFEPTVTPDPYAPTNPIVTAEPIITADPFATAGGNAGTGGEVIIGASSLTSNGFTVRNLSGRAPVLHELTQQYTEWQRQQFATYLQAIEAVEQAQAEARKEADKFSKGKSNSLSHAGTTLSDEVSHLMTEADALASEFGHSRIQWTLRYENDRDFNEVKVDFN